MTHIIQIVSIKLALPLVMKNSILKIKILDLELSERKYLDSD